MPDMKENWLPVPGYEGLYSVSNLGNVMSMNYNKTGLQSIAKSLGVDPSAISRIIGGKRWIRTTVSTVGG